MAMRQQVNHWREDTLIKLDTLLGNALRDPDLTPKEMLGVAHAGRDLLTGWKKMVITFSASNPGWEFRDLPTREIQILRSVEHTVELLNRLGAE